ncbi:carbohydrate-binding domain-containing protein [Paeniroseomonas aquatica]
MEELSSDPAFNATMSEAFTGTIMDGDGYANSSHMGAGDVSLVAAALARDLSPVISELVAAAPPEVALPVEVAPQVPLELVTGIGNDALVIHIAQDAYQGDAQYSVRVDGKAIGETFTANALHKAGTFDILTLYGDWNTGSHDVKVTLLNDAWGGTSDTDRNLYVESASFNGVAITGAVQGIWDDTSGAFSFTEAATVNPESVTETPTINPEPVLVRQDIDWDATSTAVMAHFNDTGSWGNISDFYVWR